MFEKDKAANFVRSALKEDIGKVDITSAFLIPSVARIKAYITAKSQGVLCGMPLVEMVYNALDAGLSIKINSNEGDLIEHGKAVCYLDGCATSILKGERVALNFLSRASGIATLTRKFVDKVRKYKVDIMDTRKTTPNMRYIERYSVKVGGGVNHRFGLFDQVLIKDNHLAVLKELKSGSKGTSFINDAVTGLKRRIQKNTKIEIEVKDMAEFEEALSCGVDIIMLDNMPLETVKEAVKVRHAGGINARQVKLEVSGGITLENVEEYAKAGIDRISIGALTHSAPSLDFSLEVI